MKDETIIIMNGRKYRAVRADAEEMSQTNCDGCAFHEHCKKHRDKAVVPSFAGTPVCQAISCIWQAI